MLHAVAVEFQLPDAWQITWLEPERENPLLQERATKVPAGYPPSYATLYEDV